MKRLFIIFLLVLFNIGAVWGRVVWVSGESAAITLFYEGVYVSGTYIVSDDEEKYDPSLKRNIMAGDIIVAVDGNKVEGLDDFYTTLSSGKEEKYSIKVQVVRKGERLERELRVFPKKQAVPLCGLYLKDRLTGIGTITYFDEEQKAFGSLGHSLQSNEERPMHQGVLYKIPVLSVHKSSKGKIGEKIADTSSLFYIGNVKANTIYGIYGTYETKGSAAKKMETAARGEAHLGKATILTVLDGHQVEEFVIEIDRLTPQSSQDTKGIHFLIQDRTLINRSGGIVQGMSGSPIVQDGKLIGAVTHVIVTSPLEGYGVYIDFMLEESDKVLEN